ncbi:MAG: hypothetical protein NXI20_24630 [bacterium]|nr:hypothetical protein [bacterium]
MIRAICLEVVILNSKEFFRVCSINETKGMLNSKNLLKVKKLSFFRKSV